MSPWKHEAPDELPDVLLRSNRPLPRAQLIDEIPAPPRISGRLDRTTLELVVCRHQCNLIQADAIDHDPRQPPGLDYAKRRSLLSSDPLGEASRRVWIAVEQLDDRAIDHR